MIKKALHAWVIGTVCLIIGLHLACWLLLALLNLLLDLSTSLLASFMGLRGISKLGEGARALAGRHVLGILELGSNAGAHVGYLVVLFLVSVDGSFHQLLHLGLELLLLLSCLNFSLLQSNNTLSDAINSCRRFHFLAHTGFLNRSCSSSNLKLHFFLCLCLRESHAILYSLVDDSIFLSEAHRIKVGINHGARPCELVCGSLEASDGKERGG